MIQAYRFHLDLIECEYQMLKTAVHSSKKESIHLYQCWVLKSERERIPLTEPHFLALDLANAEKVSFVGDCSKIMMICHL